jgi:arylformamidase
MKALYLSYFLNENTPIYGGKTGTLRFEKLTSISNGDTSNSQKFELPAHAGTHIDFPFHFSNKGKKCIDYPASFWFFNKVGFLNCTINEFESQINYLNYDIEILILKTGFGAKRGTDEYWSEQPVIPSYFASLLKKKFPLLRVFGFDLISLTSKQNRPEGKKAHIDFLIHNDILILEDMDLNYLDINPNLVIIAPLQVEGADGVPCNVLSFFN